MGSNSFILLLNSNSFSIQMKWVLKKIVKNCAKHYKYILYVNKNRITEQRLSN